MNSICFLCSYFWFNFFCRKFIFDHIKVSGCIVQLPNQIETIFLGVEICEDMWDDDYTCKITDELVDAGAQMILNISSSPFSEGKFCERERLIKRHVDRCRVPFLYCNLVGGQDELIFDGNSIAYSANGKRIAAATSFKEEIVIVDLDSDEEIGHDNLSREEELFAA